MEVYFCVSRTLPSIDQLLLLMVCYHSNGKVTNAMSISGRTYKESVAYRDSAVLPAIRKNEIVSFEGK